MRPDGRMRARGIPGLRGPGRKVPPSSSSREGELAGNNTFVGGLGRTGIKK